MAALVATDHGTLSRRAPPARNAAVAVNLAPLCDVAPERNHEALRAPSDVPSPEIDGMCRRSRVPLWEGNCRAGATIIAPRHAWGRFSGGRACRKYLRFLRRETHSQRVQDPGCARPFQNDL